MKVIEVICSAMPWAASWGVPIQPIMMFEATNSPPSATMVSPMGQPIRAIWRMACQSGRQKRWNRLYLRATGTQPA